MKCIEITEGYGNEPVKLKDKNLLSEIESQCSSALYRWKTNNFIFKGILANKTVPLIFTNPLNYIRKSRNTKNYYTLLIDNLPSWKSYPKRSQSLICSTSEDTSGMFGSNYFVLPVNDTKIGICAADDIWYSFSNIFRGDISGFHRFYKGLSDSSYEKFLTDFLKNKDKITRMMASYSNNDYKFQKFIKLLVTVNTKTDLAKVLDTAYSPMANKFKLTNIENFNLLKKSDREVWVGGPCYLVLTYSDVASKLLQKYQKNKLSYFTGDPFDR